MLKNVVEILAMPQSVHVRSMQATSIGCVDFAKPFVLPTGSTFKDVGGRANSVAVVYVPDPIRQLMPSQVAQYALNIGRISFARLPLPLGAPNYADGHWEVGTSSTPKPLLVEDAGLTKESDDDCTMTIANFDATITRPSRSEGGGGNRQRSNRRATMSGVSLAAHMDTASSTATSQGGHVGCSQPISASAHDLESDPPLDRTMMPTQNGMKLCAGEAGGSFEGTRQSEHGLYHESRGRSRTPVHNRPSSDASSGDSDSVRVLGAIPPRAGGSRSTADLQAQSARPRRAMDEPIQIYSDASRGTSSDGSGYEPVVTQMRSHGRSVAYGGPGAGADRAGDALQEALNAFMAADLKYSAACEAANSGALDQNSPLKHVSTNYPITSVYPPSHGILGRANAVDCVDVLPVWRCGRDVLRMRTRTRQWLLRLLESDFGRRSMMS